MSQTSTLTFTGSIGGVAMSSTVSRAEDGNIGQTPAALAATAGTQTDWTSGTAFELTMDPGHGIQTGDVIDVYWLEGGVEKRRYDVDVGTVAGDVVPVTAGSGDAMPSSGSSALTAAVQQVIDTDFDGDLLVMIGALLSARGHLSFFATGDSNELAIDFVGGEIWLWINGQTAVNPLAGVDVVDVRFTQAGTTAGTMKFGLTYDSTS